LGVGAAGFQDLYRQLQAALSLNNDSDAASGRDRASPRGGHTAAAGVFYHRQGRYGVANTDVGNRSPVRQGGERKMAGTARTDDCWNCGDPSHRLADCTNGRIDWEKVRKSRSKFWAERRPAKDVTATFYHEICNELVGTSMLGSDEMRHSVEHQIEEGGPDITGAVDDKDGSPESAVDAGAQAAALELFYAMTGVADYASTGRGERGPRFRPGV